VRRDDLGCYVAIISHARPQAIAKMTELVGGATWFVGYGEAPVYAAASAVVESGKLCESRNAALKAAAAEGLPCVQLSDDLRKLELATDPKHTSKLSFAQAVGLIRDACKIAKAHLGGVAPTANAFYFNPNRPVKTAAFIVGDFIYVHPNPRFFDENLKLKEDYDYTLQHLKWVGRVARVDNVLATFAHRSNPGGAVDYRISNASAEQEAIAYLKKKWGMLIRDNPRRPNEILLNLPKQRRAK
jgi:hypothetical protein